MLKVLAGGLSATFNIDGQHLERYLGQSWSRLSEQIFRVDKWSVCLG
jgi:hypothetical protein